MTDQLNGAGYALLLPLAAVLWVTWLVMSAKDCNARRRARKTTRMR